MRNIILDRLLDESDEKMFRFSIICDVCGRKWEHAPIRFSKADVEPATDAKRIVFDKLYQREKDWAKNKVVEEAVKYYNLCPICGRLTCNDCFLICEDLDMCQSCAEALQEIGETVTKNQLIEESKVKTEFFERRNIYGTY